VELAAAKAELQSYAAQLESRAAELARANAELQAEISVRKEAEERLVRAQKAQANGDRTTGRA
jgi:exonuclease VII small subunit